ncbi:MAG: signal recognition particle-docking protein FtsY [Acidobacteriota bacterium]
MDLVGRVREGLRRTAQQVFARFDQIARRADASERRHVPVDAETSDALEELLIGADVGVAASERIVAGVRGRVRRGESLREMVQDELLAILTGAHGSPPPAGDPTVILVVGVNGTGKTTTVAKLAHLFRSSGQHPLVCAADTFRAAAVEQLEIWAERVAVDIVRARDGADPAAVVFDALAAGRARRRSPVIVDTAGRLHTKSNLMQELQKIRRVAAREVEGAPHEVLLVLDATVGQNGLVQAREFLSASGVTGIVLAKLDGTAKGGVAVAIAHDLRLPIRYVGIGEGIDDLVPFSPRAYVDALFAASR